MDVHIYEFSNENESVGVRPVGDVVTIHQKLCDLVQRKPKGEEKGDLQQNPSEWIGHRGGEGGGGSATTVLRRK